MQVACSIAAAMGLALVGAGPLLAQRAPVAVPIVGSPAAEPPPQEPRQMPPPVSAPPPAVPPSSGPRTLDLSVSDGTVALDARNVPLREILAEWERRSGCLFVNADKVPALPVTVQFPAGTPQTKVLESLLRGLGTGSAGYGYIVAPRAGQTAASAPCGAVYLLPSSRPTASAGYAPPPPIVSPGSPDDEIPPVVPFPVPPPTQPRPMPGQLPPAEPGQPGQMPPGGSSPSAPPSGFAPFVPTAPGAGGVSQPPPTSPPQGGRGGTPR